MTRIPDNIRQDAFKYVMENKPSELFKLIAMNPVIQEFLEQDIGVKVRKFMSKKIKYTDGEIGTVKIVQDFLPSPTELLLKDFTISNR